MKHLEPKDSLDSKLKIWSKFSIEILSNLEVIAYNL